MGIPCNINYVVVVTILIVGVNIMKIDTVLSQRPPSPVVEQSCWGIASFVTYCSSYIHRFSSKVNQPSKKCCDYARKTDIALFCKRFVSEKERIYSSTKVVNVARHCGAPLPSGTKCGSKFKVSLILLIEKLNTLLYILIENDECNIVQTNFILFFNFKSCRS